jgi:hypothetical protein
MNLTTLVALILGYAILVALAGLTMLAVAAYINDKLRMAFPRYDRWLYDDVGRWNAKQRNRAQREGHEKEIDCL